MYVMHLIDSLGGSGGAEQGMVREITRFSPDVQQTIVRLFPADALSPLCVDAGIRDHWLGLTDHSAKKAYPTGIRRMVQLLRDEKPDVLHTSLFAANIIGQVAARITRTPVLSTFTLSGDPHLLRAHQPDGASRRAEMLRKLGGVAARRSKAHFRSLTRDAGTTNASLLRVPDSRITIIPRGVPGDLRPEPLMPRSELGVPEEGRLIINVGREVAQKGQIHLMHVFAKLKVDHPDLQLAICGRSGETSDDLTRLTSELGLEGSVTRLGYTEHVHHLLGHATVFAFPSLMEGLGTALLEAMSVGTPIVGFDIPPVREAVGDDGAILVPLGDEAALCDEIDGLLIDEPARQACIAAGRRRVTEYYAIDTIAGRVEELLTDTATNFSR